MSKNLSSKIGTGLSPETFIKGMTKNQDKFLDWYRRFEWTDPSNQAFFKGFKNSRNLRCFVLMADWCGDVVRNVPVVFHILESAQIPVEVLIMEQNLDVMDEFLTMGGRSIPIVLFTDESGDVLEQWGPRPKYIQEPMVMFKTIHTDKSAPDYEEHLQQARQEVIRRYGEGTDYQNLIVAEVRKIFDRL